MSVNDFSEYVDPADEVAFNRVVSPPSESAVSTPMPQPQDSTSDSNSVSSDDQDSDITPSPVSSSQSYQGNGLSLFNTIGGKLILGVIVTVFLVFAAKTSFYNSQPPTIVSSTNIEQKSSGSTTTPAETTEMVNGVVGTPAPQTTQPQTQTVKTIPRDQLTSQQQSLKDSENTSKLGSGEGYKLQSQTSSTNLEPMNSDFAAARALKIENELQSGSVVYLKPQSEPGQPSEKLVNYVSPGIRALINIPEGLIGIPGALVEAVLESPIRTRIGVIPPGIRLLGKVSSVAGDRLLVQFLYFTDATGNRMAINGVVFDQDGQGVRGVLPRDWSKITQLADRAMVLVPGVGYQPWYSGVVSGFVAPQQPNSQALKVAKGKKLVVLFLDVADRPQDPLLASYQGTFLPPTLGNQPSNQSRFSGGLGNR